MADTHGEGGANKPHVDNRDRGPKTGDKEPPRGTGGPVKPSAAKTKANAKKR